MFPLLSTNTLKENLAEFLLENAGGILNNFIASSEPLSDWALKLEPRKIQQWRIKNVKFFKAISPDLVEKVYYFTSIMLLAKKLEIFKMYCRILHS